MHAALYQAQPGTVLVCDGAGSTRCAMFGELMATDAANQRLAGLVLQGPVRDIADIDELGFPVWCAGTAPGQAAKAAVVSVGLPVVVGGVLVASGDQVIADRDGVAVVPATQWPAIEAEAAALAAKEERTRARLAAGERLADINGLDLARFLPDSNS
jgi:4-hydroxy-4-methyl-2-oxoglutarate aldolase